MNEKLLESYQKTQIKLMGYIMRTDARLLAMQMSVSEFLKLSEEENEKFEKLLSNNYKLAFQKMIEKAEDENPELAASLLDDENPY